MNQFAPGWLGFVSFALAIILPALVTLVTKESWSGTVKSLVLLVFAAAKSIGEAFVLSGHLSVDTLTATAYTFVIGVVGYVVIKGTPLHVALVSAGVSDPPPPPARVGSIAPTVAAGDGLPPGFSMPTIVPLSETSKKLLDNASTANSPADVETFLSNPQDFPTTPPAP